MKSVFYKIAPFVALGITVFIFMAGLIILAYILIFGSLIGLILFGINWLRNKLSAKSQPPARKVEKKGRTIDHNDI